MSRKPRSEAGAKALHPKGTAKRSKATKPKATAKPKTKVKATAEGAEPKVKTGRPTKYDPAYCDQVVEWGKQGKSGEWIACEIGVIYETMLNWSKEHPAFFEALTLAKQYELRWWEDAGQQHLTTTGFSAAGWSRSMAARFPKKWREKTQVDHGLSNELAALLGEIDGDGAALV